MLCGYDNNHEDPRECSRAVLPRGRYYCDNCANQHGPNVPTVNDALRQEWDYIIRPGVGLPVAMSNMFSSCTTCHFPWLLPTSTAARFIRQCGKLNTTPPPFVLGNLTYEYTEGKPICIHCYNFHEAKDTYRHARNTQFEHECPLDGHGQNPDELEEKEKCYMCGKVGPLDLPAFCSATCAARHSADAFALPDWLDTNKTTERRGTKRARAMVEISREDGLRFKIQDGDITGVSHTQMHLKNDHKK